MIRRLPLLLACIALLSLPVRNSWAGLFSDDEARNQVTELRQAIDALSKRVDTAAQSQLDFANQIEALRAEIAQLRGQVEVIANGLDTAQKRQQDFYVDLDNRLRKLEGGAAPSADAASAAPAGTVGGAPAKPADPQAEMRDYEAGLGLFRESKFKEAQGAFEAFNAKYPKSTLLPNSHYWLGSSLYQQKQYDAAAKAFGNVAASWPNDAKAPDALLAQANALVGAKDVKGAIAVLETLIEKYPTSPNVETARARLKTLAPKKKR